MSYALNAAGDAHKVREDLSTAIEELKANANPALSDRAELFLEKAEEVVDDIFGEDILRFQDGQRFAVAVSGHAQADDGSDSVDSFNIAITVADAPVEAASDDAGAVAADEGKGGSS